MVTRWGAGCNAIGLTGHRDELGSWELGRSEVESSAEVESRFVERQAPDGGPEIERVAVGAASEAVIALTGEMDREGPT